MFPKLLRALVKGAAAKEIYFKGNILFFIAIQRFRKDDLQKAFEATSSTFLYTFDAFLSEPHPRQDYKMTGQTETKL